LVQEILKSGTDKKPEAVQNGPNKPNCTVPQAKKDNVIELKSKQKRKPKPPKTKGSRHSEYRPKMLKAVQNRAVQNLRYSTLIKKAGGGSRSTAKEVLESLKGKLVYQDSNGLWYYIDEKRGVK